MNHLLSVLCVGGVLALAFGSAQAPAYSTQDDNVIALKALEAQWVKDFAAKDLERLVAHYVDDAILMAPGMPAAQGKDAIRGVLKEMLADPNLLLVFQASRVEVSKAGDYAYTQGSYNICMTDPKSKKPARARGSYVTVYNSRKTILGRSWPT